MDSKLLPEHTSCTHEHKPQDAFITVRLSKACTIHPNNTPNNTIGRYPVLCVLSNSPHKHKSIFQEPLDRIPQSILPSQLQLSASRFLPPS